MSSRYVVTIFVDTGDRTEEWQDWAVDHTADLIRLPGFTASRSYRVRDDYTMRHPETFASQPPYDLMTYYEVDEEGLEFLTTVERPVGDPPAGGTRDFPSPLGKNVGHAFLWEALQEENTRPGSEPGPRTSSEFLVTIFVDTKDRTDEWRAWAVDHTVDLMALPGFTASRAYAVRDDYKARHPETFASQPPYDLMTFYEVDDEGVELLTTVERPVGDPPAGGTRDFPSPNGENVGHAFLWEALQEENTPDRQIAGSTGDRGGQR